MNGTTRCPPAVALPCLRRQLMRYFAQDMPGLDQVPEATVLADSIRAMTGESREAVLQRALKEAEEWRRMRGMPT
jgi:hypothetical protein